MKITWIVIGVSLIALGGFAGYGLWPLFNTIEVDDPVPEIVQDEPDDAEEDVQEPSSITMQHLGDDEKREMMLAMIDANRGEPAEMEDAMPELATTDVSTSTLAEGNAGETNATMGTSSDESISVENAAAPFDPSSTFSVIDTPLHPAEGGVRVLETAEGTVIRFENFSTINGPNLHLYLARDLEGNDYIDLGPIRGTSGNINYLVPDDVDLSEYRYVMHWCVPFRVLFNYVDLGQ